MSSTLALVAGLSILATSLATSEATHHLLVSVTVAPSCTIRTTGDVTARVSLSCTRGMAAPIVIATPGAADPGAPDPAATETGTVIVATINF